MGRKYIIEYEKEGCIGAGVCIAWAPKFWEFINEQKATLKGSKDEKGIWRLEIDEKDLPQNIEAAQGCPVNVIKIFEKETGKQIK